MTFPSRFDCNSVQCVHGKKDYVADAVLVSATPHAATTNAYTPALSANKTIALRNVNLIPSSKVLLAFHTAWWREEGAPFGGRDLVGEADRLLAVVGPVRDGRSGAFLP